MPCRIDCADCRNDCCGCVPSPVYVASVLPSFKATIFLNVALQLCWVLQHRPLVVKSLFAADHDLCTAGFQCRAAVNSMSRRRELATTCVRTKAYVTMLF